MTTLTLRPGEEWRLLMGQRAVYAGEVAQIEGELMAGGVADVRPGNHNLKILLNCRYFRSM